MCLYIPLSISAVSRDERGESWRRGGRRKWLSGHFRHPERRTAHRICYHASTHHLLWTDTAWIAEDLNTNSDPEGLTQHLDLNLRPTGTSRLKYEPAVLACFKMFAQLD